MGIFFSFIILYCALISTAILFEIFRRKFHCGDVTRWCSVTSSYGFGKGTVLLKDRKFWAFPMLEWSSTMHAGDSLCLLSAQGLPLRYTSERFNARLYTGFPFRNIHLYLARCHWCSNTNGYRNFTQLIDFYHARKNALWIRVEKWKNGYNLKIELFAPIPVYQVVCSEPQKVYPEEGMRDCCHRCSTTIIVRYWI